MWLEAVQRGCKEKAEKAMLKLVIDEKFATCILKLSESRLILFVERKRGLIALNLNIKPPRTGKERQGQVMGKLFNNWEMF